MFCSICLLDLVVERDEKDEYLTHESFKEKFEDDEREDLDIVRMWLLVTDCIAGLSTCASMNLS